MKRASGLRVHEALCSFALAVALLCVRAITSAADDGSFSGAGADVFPSQADHVRMVGEEVVIERIPLSDRPYDSTVHGECVFVLENQGPGDSVLVGFPDFGSGSPDETTSAPTLDSIRIWVDGDQISPRLVDVAREANPFPAQRVGRYRVVSYVRVYVWTVYFAAGESKVLRTEYWHGPSGSVESHWDVLYVLVTGATWAGPIGKVVVRVRPAGMIPITLRSSYDDKSRSPWRRVGDDYVWTSQDVEPAEDLYLSFRDPKWDLDNLAREWRQWIALPERRRMENRHFILPGLGFDSYYWAEMAKVLPDSLADAREYILAENRKWK